MTARPPEKTALDLADEFSGVLLDAYGVLVAHGRALDGAGRFIAELNDRDATYFVVTNDASRRPSTCASFYRGVGLAIDEDRVISSGSLLAGYFREHDLDGARCVVLGPADSKRLVEEAGGTLTGADDDGLDVLVVADEAGYDFLHTIDDALSSVFRALDAGRAPRLVLPNPDLLYPKGDGAVGLAAGSIAGFFERALALRYRTRAPGFDRLGKPHAPIFDEAVRRAGTKDLVMIGDQIATDVRGARDAGLAAGLSLLGVDRWADDLEVAPDFLVPTLV